jgi:hypothetical protein
MRSRSHSSSVRDERVEPRLWGTGAQATPVCLAGLIIPRHSRMFNMLCTRFRNVEFPFKPLPFRLRFSAFFPSHSLPNRRPKWLMSSHQSIDQSKKGKTIVQSRSDRVAVEKNGRKQTKSKGPVEPVVRAWFRNVIDRIEP